MSEEELKEARELQAIDNLISKFALAKTAMYYEACASCDVLAKACARLLEIIRRKRDEQADLRKIADMSPDMTAAMHALMAEVKELRERNAAIGITLSRVKDFLMDDSPSGRRAFEDMRKMFRELEISRQ